MTDFGKEEPSADMREFARMVREMYVALIKEGFSVIEAMGILATVITSNMGNGKS